MTNLTLTIHFCDISQSFVSATKYENTSMLEMLPRLKTTPPHQISSYLTLTKKLISNVFVKGIFGYLLKAPLKVDTYNYVTTSITGSFSFIGSLVLTPRSSCALTKGKKQKKNVSSCSMITLNCVPS
jgi:hypothetical protein